MTIHYQLTFEDYKEAMHAHYRNESPTLQFFTWILATLGLIIGVFIFLAERNVLVSLMAFLGCAYFFCYTTVFRSWHISRSWKKSPKTSLPVHVQANELSYEVSSDDASVSVKWKVFLRSMETQNTFMVYFEKRQFYIIPKRAFANDAQREEFRALLRYIGVNSQQPPLPEP